MTVRALPRHLTRLGIGTSHRAHWVQRTYRHNNAPALPSEPQRNSCSHIGPVGREAFRSAAEGSAFGFASREMSLMLAIPFPSGLELELKRPSKGWPGPPIKPRFLMT